MKKLIIFVIVTVLCLFTFGCKHRDVNYDAPATFYYVQNQDALDLSDHMIRSETHETAHFHSDLIAIMNAYFEGPASVSNRSPFPTGLSVVRLDQDEDRIYLTLNNVFTQLEGLDLSVASTCISMTLFELTGCNCVELSAEGTLSNDEETVVISRDILYLSDLSHKEN